MRRYGDIETLAPKMAFAEKLCIHASFHWKIVVLPFLYSSFLIGITGYRFPPRKFPWESTMRLTR